MCECAHVCVCAYLRASPGVMEIRENHRRVCLHSDYEALSFTYRALEPLEVSGL